MRRHHHHVCNGHCRRQIIADEFRTRSDGAIGRRRGFPLDAIEGMTKALAWEVGAANIRVNTVCPTFIETAMTAEMFADTAFRGWVLERIVLGRLGRVEEVMGAIVFLASDASSLVTGSALMLDGGWSAA